jgi:hypothetical protein
MRRKYLSRSLASLVTCCVLVLTSCGPVATQPGAATPVATKPTWTPRSVQASPLPTQPQLTTVPTQPVAATELSAPSEATPATSFVIPKDTSTTVTLMPLPEATYDKPDIAREVQRFFELIYQARSLERGGSFNIEALRRLVADPYADYTIPLFEREVGDAKTGKLLEVHFSDLAVKLEEWQPVADQFSGTARVSVTRTRSPVRTDNAEPPQTATYQFRLERRLVGEHGVAWVAIDFLNPATNQWISEATPTVDQKVADEIQHFFDDFYAARTLSQGGKFDLDKTAVLTQLAYQAYTLPLLQQQQQEADEGKLTAVSYSNIKVEVLNYDPKATDHGGLATVRVTRTAHVNRPRGEESPQTATYQFRVHNHQDEAGRAYWLAVDFFQPQAQQWVSEIAGMSVSVPSAGHG